MNQIIDSFLSYFVFYSLLQPFIVVRFATFAVAIDHSDPHYTIKTNKGRVQGFRQETPGQPVITYLGIPYAKPPVGRLRFKHPRPADPWPHHTLNASKFSNSCFQIIDTLFGNFSGSQMWNPNTPMSEDCLYLNIWVPLMSLKNTDHDQSNEVNRIPRDETKVGQKRDKNSNNKNVESKRNHHSLAVMVWVYGGGFYSGTASLNVYDGKYLAGANEVIVVSMNYRLGSLGFLYMGTPEAPGNAGLFDQRLALQWVYDNIAEFGGDRNRITLIGESAGASSVDMHMLSPGSWNYFNRAIMQSGSALNYWATVEPGEAIKRGLRLAEGLDCPHKRDSIHAALDCLRTADPSDIVTHDWVTTEYMKFPFVPVVDGLWFEENPIGLMAKRKFKKTSLLMGTNFDEGTYFNIYQLTNLFIPLEKAVTVDRHAFAKALPELFPQFNQIGRKAILYEYTHWEDPSDPKKMLDAFDKSVGDYYFTCGVNMGAFIYTQSGANVFKYYYTHRSSTHPWPSWMGVMHADEINYIFGEPLDPSKGYKPKEIELSWLMMRFWTNFAKTGNPNINDDGTWSDIQWPIHTAHNREYLNIAIDAFDVGRGPRIKECAFWNEFMPDLALATQDLSDLEIQWKAHFNDWKTKYIVDWKLQFEKYVARQNSKYDNCHFDNKT